MTPPRLTTVPTPVRREGGADAELYNLGRGPETVVQRLRRLQKESRTLAREEVESLANDVNALAQRAADIAAGGDAFPAGIREMASRFASDLPDKAKSLMLIMERTGRV